MPAVGARPMRYLPICGAKTENALATVRLGTEALLPPGEFQRKERDLIRFAESASTTFKLPAVLARNQVAAWA